jgi:hypothetical protein
MPTHNPNEEVNDILIKAALKTPGEDAWLDEIQIAVEAASTMSEERNKLRTILRAYRANLLANIESFGPEGVRVVNKLRER